MANGVNGKKLLGGDRYSQYVDEITTEGTIAGQTITGAERKEAFKKRGDKINFEKFVNKVLAKKAGVGGGGGGQLPGAGVQKLLPGTVDVLKKSDDTAEIDGEKQPSLKDVLDFLKNILEPSLTSIEQNLNNILGNLEGQVDVNKENAEQLRLQQDAAADDAREAKLESKGISPIQKTLDKVIKPVSSFFDMILKFFTNVLLGAGVLALLDIINNPEKIMKPIRDFANGVTGFVNDMTKALWKWVIDPINWVADGLNVGIKAVSDGINTVLNMIPGVEDPLPVFQIPIAREAPQIPKWEPPAEARMEGGGKLDGPSHSQGGIPIEAEGGEFIVNKTQTAKFLPLLETINDGGGTNRPELPEGLGGGGGGTNALTGQAKVKTWGSAFSDFFSGDDGESRRMTDLEKSQRMSGGGLVQHFSNGGLVGNSARIDEIKAGSYRLQDGSLQKAAKELQKLGMNSGRIEFWKKKQLGLTKRYVKNEQGSFDLVSPTLTSASVLPSLSGGGPMKALEAPPSIEAVKKVSPPGPPGGGGGKNIVMVGGKKTGATGFSGGGTNGGSVTPFSASDIRNDGTLVIKSIYNIVG